MDIYAIRLANLGEIIRTRFAGVARRFALDADLDPSYVSRLFSANPRGRKRIGDDLARKWETRYGYPEGWMDHVHHVSDQHGGYRAEDAMAAQWCRLTVRSWTETGLMSQDAPPSPERQLLVPGQYGPTCYLLIVQGDTMIDPATGSGFPAGCHIVVDPDAEPRHGSFVIVEHPDAAERTFKQLVHDGTRRLLKPINPRYPITDLDHAEIVGVVRAKVMHEEFAT